MPFDPSADLAGASEYSNMLASQAVAGRKTAAYNALAKVYGPLAGDPQAAADAAKADILAQQAPALVQQPGLENQQTQANIGNISAEAATRNAALPYVGPQAAAELAHTGAQTGLAQQQTANEKLQGQTIIPEAGSRIHLQNAQAGLAGTEAAKTAQETQIAGQQNAFMNAYGTVGALITARDQAVQGGAKDGGSAAIAASAHNLIPSLAAMGVPPDQAAALAREAVTNPSVLDQLQTTATNRWNAMAQSKGMPVLTTQALTQAAQNYQRTGQPTISGMGGAKVNTAVLNAAANLQGGIGGVPAAQQQFKSAQSYKNQLASSSLNEVGGKLDSINAIAGHADLMEQYINAINNKDLRGLNTVQQEWKKQTGSPMPTNFDAQKNLLAGELTRYYTSRGSVEMTKEFQSDMSKANSPAQLLGVLNTWKQDAGQQVAGYRQQATAYGAASDFDKHLTPGAQKLLTGSQSTAPATGGWGNFRVTP